MKYPGTPTTLQAETQFRKMYLAPQGSINSASLCAYVYQRTVPGPISILQQGALTIIPNWIRICPAQLPL